MAGKFEFRLENGMDALLVSSFLQKYIREGKTNEAYFFARMYYPKYRKYLAKRLRQCLPEEIGMANLSLYPTVLSLCDELVKEKEDGIEIIKQIVVLLCCSYKNKWTDLSWIWHKFHPKMKTHPAKSLDDCKTLQDYLALYLSHFESIKDTKKIIIEASEKLELPLLKHTAEAIEKNAQSTSCKGLGCWLFLSAQISIVKPILSESISLPDTSIIDDSFTMNIEEVPDYFYDMHTLKGKRTGRDQIHWFKECCKVDKYLRLPTDFRFDPLKTGFNQEGISDEIGILEEFLIFPEGDIQTTEQFYG